jgi:hypothetical protein
MASLIETLIEVLDKENEEYEKLLDLSDNKTSAIVQGDVEKLQEILVNEQKHINKITALDQKREENVKDISNVLNLPKDNVKVDMIIGMLEKQPKERDALRSVHLKLKRTLNQLMKINDNNKLLMQESMDMIEFELNLAQNALRAPQTGNYSKGAYEQNTMPNIGKFDAKQ